MSFWCRPHAVGGMSGGRSNGESGESGVKSSVTAAGGCVRRGSCGTWNEEKVVPEDATLVGAVVDCEGVVETGPILSWLSAAGLMLVIMAELVALVVGAVVVGRSGIGSIDSSEVLVGVVVNGGRLNIIGMNGAGCCVVFVPVTPAACVIGGVRNGFHIEERSGSLQFDMVDMFDQLKEEDDDPLVVDPFTPVSGGDCCRMR